MIPLLTVAIATKNREYFCIKAIESILEFKDPRIEIAISDNSSSNEVSEYVKSLNFSQIKYIHIDKEISSIDNFNYVLNLCSGEFITLIGDDDTILPSMIKAVEWMKKNNVDTLAPKKTQRYFWPKSRPQSPTGTLDLFDFDNSFEKVDSKVEILKAVKNGLENFYKFKVAKSYHGVVRRALMEEVKEVTGNYYGGLSPDIFSVVALSYLSKNHYYIDYPLSIMGVCRDSTSAQQIFGEHVGKLENMPHLKNKPDYQWDHRVPKYYCVTNTWAESGFKALKELKANDILKQANIYPTAAVGILMNRKHILKLALQETEEMRKRNNISFLYFWTNTIFTGVGLSIKKIISSTIRPDHKFNSLEDIADISTAQKICMEQIDDNFFTRR